MEYRTLGASGLKVSRLCLGAMMFGERADAKTASLIMQAAREAGVNFVDTADAYGEGESERIVGKFVMGERDRWVIATKFASRMAADDPNSGGASRKWMMQAVEASLRRLGTDYIDVYYFHRDDRDTPLEESLATMDDLIRAGKVRYFGLSNIAGWRIAKIAERCQSLGMPQPIVLQPYYNALYRLAEVEQLPACRHYGIGVVPYSPLARGVLTGKYLPDRAPPADSRGGRGEPRFLETEMRRESLEIAQVLKRHAAKRGMTAAQFALNWVLANTIVSSVLTGPRTLEQCREYLGALSHRIDAEDEALVDGLIAPGHGATPGYTDPKYPVTGRIAAGEGLTCKRSG